jgi:hypothetical protein
VNRTITRATVPLALALFVVACGGGGDDAAETTAATTAAPTTTAAPATTTTSVAPSTTSSSTTSTTTTVPEVLRMPLTGVPVADEAEIPARPALAVKIDNAPPARPQAGLNEADVVFEENVENLTRFAAVFHSQGSDPVGPIRSGRTQDVDMLGAFSSPLFAWSGGNAGVRAYIRDSDLIDLDAVFTPGYYRRSGRGGAPHNLYSSTDALWANTPAEFTVPSEPFHFVDEAVTGEPATVVELAMDGVSVRWEYDAEAGVYRRFQNGRPHDTELTGQVTTDNLVVMAVEYLPSFVDRNSPEAQTVGTGPVVIFSDGVARVGSWIRLDRTDPYDFFVGEGDDLEVLGLTPGRTWVELARPAESFVTWTP